MDSLAGLAEADAETVAALQQLTTSRSPLLTELWQSLRGAEQATEHDVKPPQARAGQYLVLVECRDEAQQVELLARFQAEGLSCKALIS
jgi:hypothetical protein